MYRICDSVSVILILCIKVDNSFMGEAKLGQFCIFEGIVCCIWVNFAELPDGVEL